MLPSRNDGQSTLEPPSIALKASPAAGYHIPSWAEKEEEVHRLSVSNVSLEVFKEGVLLEEYDLRQDIPIPVAALLEKKKEEGKQNQSLSSPQLHLPLLHHNSYWIIGKDPTVVDILAEHPSVSKQHCLLQLGWQKKGGNRKYDVTVTKTTKPTASGETTTTEKEEEVLITDKEAVLEEGCFVHLYDLHSSNGTFILGGEEQNEDESPSVDDNVKIKSTTLHDDPNEQQQSKRGATTTTANLLKIASSNTMENLNTTARKKMNSSFQKIQSHRFYALPSGTQFRLGASSRLYVVKYHSVHPPSMPLVKNKTEEGEATKNRKRKRTTASAGSLSSSDDEGKEEGGKAGDQKNNKLHVSYQAYIDQQKRAMDFCPGSGGTLERDGLIGGDLAERYFYDRTTMTSSQSSNSGSSLKELQSKRDRILAALEEEKKKKKEKVGNNNLLSMRSGRFRDLQQELMSVEGSIQQYLDVHKNGSASKSGVYSVKVVEIVKK